MTLDMFRGHYAAEADADPAVRAMVVTGAADWFCFGADPGGARLATIFSPLGVAAEYGRSWLLPRLIGPANALDLLLSGRKIEAAEAYRHALVRQVLPRPKVLPAAQAYAADLATEYSPASLAVIRCQVWPALDDDVAWAATDSVRLTGESFAGPDFREAITAAPQGWQPMFGAEAAR
jgi:enoyl-CoA hydratase/carnithine racemase